MSEKNTTQPLSVDEINNIAGVRSHFQTDHQGMKIYASNEEADALGDLSSVFLNFASRVAEDGGFGSLNRVVAYAPETKFALFGVNASNADPSGPRIVGVTVSNDVTLKAIIADIYKHV